ncbi:hypothetical protein GCM10022402_45430 [Salinactinospora qingdaonensis]|uniref:Uncharacterized protein n=1 Tax=Salinactinospora qingdaonensis TaxID=702744 RepID=A0ABP7GGU2_9ACTN
MGGKHRTEPVKCSMCDGTGYQTYNKDNQEVRINCIGCNSTDKQP